MPPPIDLTGRRFGKLLVIERAPDLVSASGKSVRSAWLCKCDCGRQEVFPRVRLPYTPSNAKRRDAAECCSYCRSQRTCVVCNKPFESLQPRATCSQACQLLHKRALYMDQYHRRVERDPELNRRRWRERDPEKAREALRRRTQKKALLRATDPEFRERTNELHRARYAERAAEVLARRRERREQLLAAMTPEEREAHDQRAREQATEAARKYRSTPAGAEANRRSVQAYLARKKLAELARISGDIAKRSDTE